ncbi:NUDIX hydrolase [Lacticaseibacillus thailandensis]|uniref:NUDIX family hydrolase n=1 Tax=Lacticaseibacillus thailandensis DSM 22698 = JCM 13996 TaxID=1423810 RepID=A0A0R2C667_9LACO|nr:NUDIX domain-containing protein [Lacticaseibacillus thailandensis]KRM87359.1 NUDIX family hydrolase [Lacticaseibacillus thailandensis DSM 22698 = JCM 13996]
MTDPVFGTKDPKLDYVERRGVYAVIPDASGQRLLMLGAPNSAIFLPGGGVEAGEDDQATLQRELLEEFGVRVTIDDKLGAAAEYFYSHHRQTAYYHPATFYACHGIEQVAPPLENFNTLMLMPISVAAGQLKRPTHRWAVARWLELQAHIHEG